LDDVQEVSLLSPDREPVSDVRVRHQGNMSSFDVSGLQTYDLAVVTLK